MPTNDEPNKHPGEYGYQSFVDRSDAFDLEVVGGPERKKTSGEDRSDGWPTSTSERDANGKGYVP